jgi:hypothetical protein
VPALFAALPTSQGSLPPVAHPAHAPHHHDAIPDHEFATSASRRSRAERDDEARRFVSEHHRKRPNPAPINDGQVGMTDAGGLNLYE